MTTLSVGGIAIVGYNAEGFVGSPPSSTSAQDGFSFVLFEAVDAGTVIKFTDSEWNGSTFANDEGALAWTASSNLAAGTVVRLAYNNTAGTFTASTGTLASTTDNGFFTNDLSTPTSGDQIFSYQGSMASSFTVLHGFTNRPSGFVSTATSSDSQLPNTLALGQSALWFVNTSGSVPDEFDNGYYNPSAATSGSLAFLQASVNNPANWVGSDSTIAFDLSPSSFNVGAPASPAEIRVSEATTEIFDGDTTPSDLDGTNLGAVDVASGAIVQTYTITNSGGTTLNLGSVTVTGADAADFQITTPPPATVAPSSAVTFSVTFNPSAAGERNATINIPSDDSDETSYDFAVRGTGALPTTGTTLAAGDIAFVGYNSAGDEFGFALLTDIVAGTVIKFTDAAWNGTTFFAPNEGAIQWTAPRDYSVGEIVIHNTSTDAGQNDFQTAGENGYFGGIFGPSSSGDQIIAYQGTATGAGDAITNIAAIHYDGNAFDAPGSVVIGDGSSDTSETFLPTGLVDGQTAISFGAGADADFNSGVWSPSVAADVASLRQAINNEANWIGTDAAGGQVIPTTQLTVGLPEPEITVQGNVNVQVFDGDTQPLDSNGTSFGPTATDAGAQVQDFVISNSGNSDLTVTGVTITGADAADFAVVSAPSGPIAANGSFTLQIAFDPSSTGLKNATVTINSNDTDEAAFDFAINAVSQAPAGGTDLSAGSIAFTGYNAITPDAFTFVVLEDLAAGTSIKFTDGGWEGTSFRAGEGAIEWTALDNLAAGTVVLVEVATIDETPNVQRIDDNGYFTGNLSPSSSGDQIIAYQGTATVDGSGITNLAAVHFNASEFNATGPISAPDSLIPRDLTDGVNAISLGSGPSGTGTEFESGVYTGPTNLSFALLAASIADEANWTTSRFSQTLLTEPFGNVAPSGTGLPASVNTFEDTASPVDLSGLVIGDPDEVGDMTLTLQASLGQLTAIDAGGVEAEVIALSGTVNLTGTAAELNTYLDTPANIQFTGQSNLIGTNVDTISVRLDDLDGSGVINLPDVSVNISNVNDAPTVTGIDGETSNIAAGTGPAAITGLADAVILDPDSPVSDGGSITITQTAGTEDGSWGVATPVVSGSDAVLAVGEDIAISGVVIGTVATDGQNGGDLVINLTVNATPALAQTLVRGLTYETPAGGSRSFTIAVNDGDGTDNGGVDTTTASFDIVAANAAPVNTVPGGQSGLVDGFQFDFTGISVADADSSTMTVTLDVADTNGATTGVLSGTLDAGGPATLVRTDSDTIELSGTLADVNTSLATLNYTPDDNAGGPGLLTMTSDDGTGGVDVDTVQLYTPSRPDLLGMDSAQNYGENAGAVPILVDFTAIRDSDSDVETVLSNPVGDTYTLVVSLDGGATPSETLGIDTVGDFEVGYRFFIDEFGAIFGLNELDSNLDVFVGNIVPSVVPGDLTIALEISGSDSLTTNAIFEDLITSITYTNTGTALSGTRDISFALSQSVPGLGSIPVGDVLTTTLTLVANAAPTVTLANAVSSVAEDLSTLMRTKVADIVVSDDMLGTNDLSLTGDDSASFEIIGTELFLRAATVLDFETDSMLDVTVNVDDPALGMGAIEDNTSFSLAITDVNESSSVALLNALTTVDVNDDTTGGLVVADISVIDDAIGTNVITLTGADSALFEVVGNTLRLKEGTVLNPGVNPVLDVTVVVEDAATLATPDGTAALSLTVSCDPTDPVIGDGLLVGTICDDDITGQMGADTLAGLAGDDTLSGGGNDDLLFGNAGNDSIDGDAGRDIINGGLGDDTVNGGDDDDIALVGDAGDDVLSGGAGNDLLSGGADNDVLNGDADNDGLNGGTGNDTLNGGTGDDRVFGGDGEDLLNGGANNDTLGGGADNDILNGDAGSDGLNGDTGNDTLDGGAGDDRIYGGIGDDELNGGGDADVLSGGADNDNINGDGGNDSMTGDAGNDTLDGGDGADRLFGGVGDDILNGGANDMASDLLIGQGGTDTFVFEGAWGADQIARYGALTTGGSRNNDEIIDLSGTTATSFADLEVQVVGTSTFVNIIGDTDNTIEILYQVGGITSDDFFFG